MIHSETEFISFAGVVDTVVIDNLALEVDERLKTLPYIEDEEERIFAAGDIRDLVFQLWNLARH
jgi:hypothetical protein